MALVLTRQDLETALPMVECIASQEEAFRQHALGAVVVPSRTVLNLPEQGRQYVVMPAILCQTSTANDSLNGALGVKVLTYYPGNPIRGGYPAIAATVLIHDSSNGRLLALIEGAFLTQLRTAAASGVATKHLARANASVVGILGTGGQAETHLLAMATVRSVTEARVFSRDSRRTADFAKRMGARVGFPVIAVPSAKAAVEGADIIVTVTSSRQPVLDGHWLVDGAHINCIASASPDSRELDDIAVLRAKVVVDTKESALAEAGDLLIPISKGIITPEWIHAELGEIVTKMRSGRTSEREITLFKSVGVAFQDVAAAIWAYRRATALGLGQSINL